MSSRAAVRKEFNCIPKVPNTVPDVPFNKGLLLPWGPTRLVSASRPLSTVFPHVSVLLSMSVLSSWKIIILDRDDILQNLLSNVSFLFC